MLHGSLTRPLLRLQPLLTTCAQQGTDSFTRSRRPPDTNLGSASAPPLPAARTPTANQRAGSSPSTPPREAGLEQDLAALAIRLANQLAEHTEGEGAQARQGRAERCLATHQSKWGPGAARPFPAPWWRRCGNQGKRRLPYSWGREQKVE